MADSVARTLVVPVLSATVGNTLVHLPTLYWPTAQPDDFLDYGLDLSAPMNDSSDSIVSAAVSVSPSGSGELTLSYLTCASSVVTFWASGGVAGRSYFVKVDVTTLHGREFEFLVGLSISPVLAIFPIPPAPSNGFSTPIDPVPFLNFSLPIRSNMRLLGWC